MSSSALVGWCDVKSGIITTVFVNWDGYPSHTGKILLNHYNDEGKLRKMLALGDLSQINEEIGEKHPFDAHSIGENHAEWHAKYGKMCHAYHRDRGERAIPARLYRDLAAWQRDRETHNYLFKDGAWWYMHLNNDPVPLTAELVA